MADGFKIADGYVEVHGVVDRRAVIAAADAVTRGVSEQMTTGVAFGNLRAGGRRMGAVLGEHGGPGAATHTTRTMAEWIDQGQSAAHIRSAGETLGALLGKAGGSPFVEHILQEIERRSGGGASPGGAATPGGAPIGTMPVGSPGSGRAPGRGGRAPDGSTGPGGGDGGRRGPAGPSGKDGEREGRGIGAAMGRGAVGGFVDAFTGGFRGVGSLITANPVVGTAAIVLGTGLATLAAPAFAAAFSSALIGGAGLGVIGLGAFLLKDDPKVRSAADRLGKTAKTVFTGAAQPLAAPFERSLGIFEQLIKDLSPDLTEMFMAISPAVEPLTRGLGGFIKEAMPGILDLVKAATPFLMDLENTLPRFGEHVGMFLSIIADSGPAASLFFRDFLHLIGLLLVWFGGLINGLSHMYAASRTIILLLVDVFMMFYKAGKWVAEQVIEAIGRLGRFVAGVWRSIKEDTGGFVSFLKELPGKAWNAIKDTPNKIKNVFSGIGDWLKDAGEKLIGGLIRGIKNAVPGLDGVLGWITDKIPDWKGPAERDRELLEPTGHMIMEGLTRGIRAGAKGLRADLGQVTASIPGGVSPAPAGIGAITINIQTQISRWSQVPDEVIGQLDAALSRYRKAYA